MPRLRYRPTLVVLLAAWLGAIAFATHMLMTAEINRWQWNFEEVTAELAGQVKHRLDTNDAVLAGLSAFLQAVDRSDTDSAMKYAAAATASYPHIYMIEIAREVKTAEQAAFQTSLRKKWRTDFTIKNFAEITGRTFQGGGQKSTTWPILFMYPSLPEAGAIYGVRLETVDYLSHTVALAQLNSKPVVSPVFGMYEGGRAYILLQEVIRSAGTARSDPDFFGSTMMALLLLKTEALVPGKNQADDYARIGFSATLLAPDNPQSLLFEKRAPVAGYLERLLLPRFVRQLKIDNASQPTLMSFERQLTWDDLLQPEKLMIALLLVGALLVVPWITVRHYASLNQAEVEQERSAYLATHDLLTGLANRFLFADRFEHAFRGWQRNGNSFALMLADLDHFKEINDLHGHDLGDQVLVTCAKRMVGELRACDTVARHGGDEFVILLLNILNQEDAENVGSKLLAAISAPIETTAGPISMSCSIGIAICPMHGISLDALRKRADQAMYRAKKEGRNSLSVFSGDVS